MLSNPNLADGVQLVAFAVGVILLVKKIAEIDGWHNLRVFVRTVVLSCIVAFLFLAYGFSCNEVW